MIQNFIITDVFQCLYNGEFIYLTNENKKVKFISQINEVHIIQLEDLKVPLEKTKIKKKYKIFTNTFIKKVGNSDFFEFIY